MIIGGEEPAVWGPSSLARGETPWRAGGATTGLRCILQCTCLQCGSEAGDAALLE